MEDQKKTAGSKSGNAVIDKKMQDLKEKQQNANNFVQDTNKNIATQKDTQSTTRDQDAASKFLQKVDTKNERSQPLNYKDLKNFKKMRKTVIVTSDVKNCELEFEKLIEEAQEELKNPKPTASSKQMTKGKLQPEEDEDYGHEEFDEEEQPKIEPDPKKTTGKPGPTKGTETVNKPAESDYMWDDPEFNPTEDDPEGLRLLDLGPEKLSTIKWMDIFGISEEDTAYIVLGHVEDQFWLRTLVQGEFNNLSFLNAMVLTVSCPRTFMRMFPPALERFHEQCLYTFRFMKNTNQSLFVAIDDRLPSIQKENGEYVPITARCFNNQEFWPGMIEKAYAKLHGGYQVFNQKDRTIVDYLRDLTGLMPEIIDIGPDRDELKLWEILLIFQKNGSILGCFQDSEKGKAPLYAETGHVYIILGVDGSSKGDRTIKLGDPWAHSTPMEDNQVGSEDGVYVVGMKEFLETFDRLIIIQDYPDNWKGIKFDCEFTPSKGGAGPTNSAWIENPQYIFEVFEKEETKILIQCHRYVGSDGRTASGEHEIFGFAVIPFIPTKIKAETADLKNMAHIAKTTGAEDHIFGFMNLSKGKYSLIPFTMKKGSMGYHYCEILFRCKEDQIKFVFPNIERALEVCVIDIDAVKPRVLTDKVTAKDLTELGVSNVYSNLDILIPLNISSYVGENSKAKTLNRSELGGTQNKTTSTTTKKVTKLYDSKLDAHNEYEKMFILLGEDDDDRQTDLDYTLLQGENAGVFDFSDYNLTDDSIFAISRALCDESKIKKLDFQGNWITDEGLTELLSKLEVGQHFEVAELDLSRNNLSDKAVDMLISILDRFNNLCQVNIDDNPLISDKVKTKLQLRLQKKVQNRP